MNIEHCVFFYEFTKERRPKNKNHAQDCETLTASGQHPAILPWFLDLGWRPSFRLGHGHLARCAQRPDCCWTFDGARSFSASSPCASPISESEQAGFRTIMQKRAPIDARVLHCKLNGECCAFRSTPDTAPRPFSSGSRGASGGWRPFSTTRDVNGCPSRGS